MKRLMFAVAACAMALSACAPNGGVASNGTGPGNSTGPAVFANQTVLDEQVGIGATNAYTAASKLGAALAQSGLVDKAKFKAADQKGYDAVQALHQAYLAGNSDGYALAASHAYAAAADIAALVK